MKTYSNFFIVICLLYPVLIFSKNNQKLKTKNLDSLIVFSGDYNAKLRFSGSYSQKIEGVLENVTSQPETQSTLQNNDLCSIHAEFARADVIFKAQKEGALRIIFHFNCKEKDQNFQVQTSPLFVNKDSLKGPNMILHISEKLKSIQLEIKEFSD